MPLPWAAMGIGALIGGLGAKQRGGNFLKGALTGAALGGVTGGLGAKYGSGAGGIFGLGTGWKGALAPAAMIGLGTEMFGQQEANLKALEGRRRMFREDEEERLRRLSQIAGYDVADPTKFLTPQSYFGRARGGLATLPHYNLGGPVGGTWADVPMEEGGPTMDPEIMQLPMGQEGSFEDENEGILGLELAGLSDSERAELQGLMSLRLITPKDDPKYPQIEMRIQELMEGISAQTGRSIGPAGASTVSDDGTRMMEMAAQGGSIKRPGYFLGGATKGLAQLFASGKAGDMAEEMYKDEELEGVYDRNLEQVKDFIGDEEGFDYRSLMLGPPRGEDTGASGDSNKKLRMILNALRATTPMAQGGHINRPGYKFGGGIDWSKVQSAMNNAGQFGGPEKVWQAKNVASTDPGVYQKGWFGGSGLTSGGENVNQAVKDWQSWRKGRIGSAYGNSDAQHIYRDNYLGNFANKYPGAAGLGMTGMDVFNQQLLEEEAPEGYAYAQGGIADLDMRGGGHSIGPGTGTSDDVPAMLSDGEFVMTAQAVENLGGGDRMTGARRMYQMMNQLDPNSQTPAEMTTVGYG